MVTIRLTDEQSARIAQLPADYRVVGLDRRAPLVRRPAGQLLSIEPNGRLVAATIAARRRLAGRVREPVRRPFEKAAREVSQPIDMSRRREGPAFATPYTEMFD